MAWSPVEALRWEFLCTKDNMEHLEDILLRELNKGTSVFKYIPDDIGDIIYCDSSNAKAAPDSKEETRKKMLLSICIPTLLIVLDWIFFYTSPIMSSIVSAILLFVMYKCVKNTLSFKGSDYFVGTKGFALCDFDGTRDNITAKASYHFDDFSDLVTAETRHYQNRVYQYTEYFFQFWSKEKDGVKNILANIQSTYNQEKPKDYYEDRTYRFWKVIEDTWSKYKFYLLKKEFGLTSDTIGFTVYSDKNFFTN